MSRKYEFYEDLISGLESEGLITDDADIGSLDDDDLETLIPLRRVPAKPPAPVKKRKTK